VAKGAERISPHRDGAFEVFSVLRLRQKKFCKTPVV